MSNNKMDFLVTQELKSSSLENDKAHPWRICPIGQHYVKEHLLHTPPSKEHPQGQIVTRHAHCADNPIREHHKDHKKKDFLSFDEMQVIAKTHFSKLNGPPKEKILTAFSRADEFDSYIRGWVQYWNEIFHPKEPLDSNLVKALIASESSFKPELNTPTGNPKLGDAHGLMQITDSTWRMITGQEHAGEVKDHFVYLSNAELMDPSANICVGVRWLFTKKTDARERLHRSATWEEAIAEYKGILKAMHEKNPNPDPKNEMPIFRGFYKQLRE